MGRTKNLGKSKKQTRKSKRSVKKSNPLINIILIFLIIIITAFTINNYILTNKYIKDNKELNASLNRLKDKQIVLLDEKNELNDEYDKTNNIDNLIKETKEEVFTLASQIENKIINGETDYKIAYLTFDDGPYYLTNSVLNILKEHQIKATFFTIGLDKDICYDNKNYSCKETYKKIVDNGHTIANHTYSHAIFRGLYSDTSSFMTQVKLQEELIKNRTGVKTNILRFPGGIGTANALARNSVDTIKNELRKNGYGWVDWTAQDGDGGYLPNYDIAWNNFTNSINEPIEVVLFHDYSTITASMLPNAIKYLEERNYILLPLFYESVKINK